MKLVIELVAVAGLLLIIAGIATISTSVALIVGGILLFLWACALYYDRFGGDR